MSGTGLLSRLFLVLFLIDYFLYVKSSFVPKGKGKMALCYCLIWPLTFVFTWRSEMPSTRATLWHNAPRKAVLPRNELWSQKYQQQNCQHLSDVSWLGTALRARQRILLSGIEVSEDHSICLGVQSGRLQIFLRWRAKEECQRVDAFVKANDGSLKFSLNASISLQWQLLLNYWLINEY